MYFLYVSLLSFVVFSGKIFAASYNQPCRSNANCNLPGLICFDDRCVCDWKSNLFWTNARCLACPKGWMRTETRCVIYMGTQLPWARAQATCLDMESDLISYRNDSTVSLIYQLTATTKRRKKQVQIASDKSVVWTSGNAVENNDLGLFQWADKSLPSFNTGSTWWCKEGMPGFAFYYQFNEPTRYVHRGVLEKCLLSRRGTTNTMILCLDDVLCEEKYPFICEKSEFTAQTYLGPPPSSTSSSTIISTITTSRSTVASTTTTNRLTTATTATTSRLTTVTTTTTTSSTSVVLNTSKSSIASKTSKSITSSTTANAASISSGMGHSGGNSADGGAIAYRNSTASDHHHDGMKPRPHSLEDDEKSKTPIILLIVFGLLLLVGVLIGIFYFIKRRGMRNIQHTKVIEKPQPKLNTSPPPPSPQPQIDTKPAEIPDVNVVEPQRTPSDEIGLSLNAGVVPERVGFNIGNQKQQKNKKGGFTTQQFADELE